MEDATVRCLDRLITYVPIFDGRVLASSEGVIERSCRAAELDAAPSTSCNGVEMQCADHAWELLGRQAPPAALHAGAATPAMLQHRLYQQQQLLMQQCLMTQQQLIFPLDVEAALSEALLSNSQALLELLSTAVYLPMCPTKPPDSPQQKEETTSNYRLLWEQKLLLEAARVCAKLCPNKDGTSPLDSLAVLHLHSPHVDSAAATHTAVATAAGAATALAAAPDPQPHPSTCGSAVTPMLANTLDRVVDQQTLPVSFAQLHPIPALVEPAISQHTDATCA
jgi:hypothetical protein